VCVDSKWEGRFDASDKFDHVVVNVALGNGSIGAANVSDEVMKGDSVETFGGVIEFRIINIVDGRRKLVACDCADNDVCVPRLVLSKVGCLSCFDAGAAAGGLMG
jgi:hypothetical protein